MSRAVAAERDHKIWSFHLVQHRWRNITTEGDSVPALKRTRAAVVKDRMSIFSCWDFQCEGGLGAG